jgi:hypothetical protein
MPGSADADTAKALSPDAPKGITPEQRVKPTERRDPATVSTMDVIGQYDAPTDHARALRGLFLEIPHLGRRGADGKLLAAPEEFDAHLEKARPHIRPEHFAEYEAIVRRLQAGEISALAAERQLRELYEVIPTWERLGEMVLDAIPVLGTIKAGIELAETLKKFHAALAAGDHDEAEKLAVEAMVQSAGLLPLGKIAAKAGGKALDVVGLRSAVANYLEHRAARRRPDPNQPVLPRDMRPPTPAERAEANELAQQAAATRNRAEASYPAESIVSPPSAVHAAAYIREVYRTASTMGLTIGRGEGLVASQESRRQLVAVGRLDPKDLRHPSYMAGTRTLDVVLDKDKSYVRLGIDRHDGSGRWMMRVEDYEAVKHLPDLPNALKSMLALPSTPKYISFVTVPAGTTVRFGIVGGHRQWGPGGAIQIELLDRYKPDWFSKPLEIERWRKQ